MSKTRHIFFFFFFTLAFFTARGQFAAKDRLLSGGFNISYMNVVGSGSEQTARRLGLDFKPQMSIFLSSHFSMGLGFDMSFAHQKSLNTINNNQITVNRIQCEPRLMVQYYRPFAEKWYASVRFDLKMVDLELSRWYGIASNQSFDLKYGFDSYTYLTAFFTPIIGYRASKHWLIEGQLGGLSLALDRTKSYKYISVNGQFRPSLFDFKAIYLWQKKAPSVSKSK